jgi:hypothetical protein
VKGVLGRQYLRRKDLFVRRTFCSHFFFVAGWLVDSSAKRIANLARGHEETKRRRVVVLEEVERETALGRELDGLGGAGLAVTGRDDVAVAGLDGNIAEVLGDGWCVAV